MIWGFWWSARESSLLSSLSQTSSPIPPLSKKLRPFSEVKSDKGVELARASGIPQSTQKDTNYCIGLWDAWASYRVEANGDTMESSVRRNCLLDSF